MPSRLLNQHWHSFKRYKGLASSYSGDSIVKFHIKKTVQIFRMLSGRPLTSLLPYGQPIAKSNDLHIDLKIVSVSV